MIRSSHRNSNKEEKISFPSFLFWPPSIAQTLSYWIMRYIVREGICPWFRGGCAACRSRDEFKCGEDVFRSNHARRTIDILQQSLFLASMVFWLILASMAFQITLSLVLVYTYFGILVSSVV